MLEGSTIYPEPGEYYRPGSYGAGYVAKCAFLCAMDDVCPEVMDELKEQVLPSYLKVPASLLWGLREYWLDIDADEWSCVWPLKRLPSEGRPEIRKKVRRHLRPIKEWANRHGIRSAWILQMAIDTLWGWRMRPWDTNWLYPIIRYCNRDRHLSGSSLREAPDFRFILSGYGCGRVEYAGPGADILAQAVRDGRLELSTGRMGAWRGVVFGLDTSDGEAWDVELWRRSEFEERARHLFEKKLKRYCDGVESAAREKGMRKGRAPRRAIEEQCRLFAAFQVGGMSMDAVAERFGVPKVKVSRAVKAMAELLELPRRRNGVPGRKPLTE